MKKAAIGKIVAPHGVRGDLRIMPLTSNWDIFDEVDKLKLSDGRELTLVSARPHKNVMLVRVEEVTSIEQAELLRGQEVHIFRDEMPELPEGTFYVGDLIGLEVLDEDGKKIGTFKDVLPTGSADVYVIAPEEGKDILVAAIPDNILKIDPKAGHIVVRLPEWAGED